MSLSNRSNSTQSDLGLFDRQDLVRSLPIARLKAMSEALLDFFTGMPDLKAWLKASEQM